MSECDVHGVLLWVAYDGRDFHGMAIQASARTVAGELLFALTSMDPHIKTLRLVSRTDAKVHARGQLVAFDSRQRIAPRGWVLGLLRHLPHSIAVVGAAPVPPGFDPRGHVVRKTYTYRLFMSPIRDPFLVGTTWHIRDRLNQPMMDEEASDLLGCHNFAAFRGASDGRTDTTRTIFSAGFVDAPGDARCRLFELTGDRFLYHMVRIIVGTLVDVGRGSKPRGTIRTALASFKRSDLGITAPPDGLTLHHVELDTPLLDRWPNIDDSDPEA
jgi:tRNA pseudouridine38-40 synthase